MPSHSCLCLPPLSIVMTSCSTILALGLMPLLLFLYCQGFADLHKMVPYLKIILSLVGILIPSGVGILINQYRPRYAKIFKKVSAGSERVKISVEPRLC